jgi:hypothetical protein
MDTKGVTFWQSSIAARMFSDEADHLASKK